MPKNHWVSLKLYEKMYPNPQIEEKLVRKLYEIAQDDAEPLRSAIVEVINKVGSEQALPALEALEFDLEPGAKVGEAFSGSLGFLGNLVARSRLEFMAKLAKAIKARSALPS